MAERSIISVLPSAEAGTGTGSSGGGGHCDGNADTPPADVAGRFLDDYVQNSIKIDHSLTVSAPDRTLMFSRGQSRCQSRSSGATAAARRTRLDSEGESIQVSFPESRNRSRLSRASACTSQSSILSFSSVLTDRERVPIEPPPRFPGPSSPRLLSNNNVIDTRATAVMLQRNIRKSERRGRSGALAKVKGEGMVRIPEFTTAEATADRRVSDDGQDAADTAADSANDTAAFPTPVQISNEWRKQLGIDKSTASSHTSTRLERKLELYLGKELKRLSLKNSTKNKTAPVSQSKPSPDPEDSDNPNLNPINDYAADRLGVYTQLYEKFLADPDMRPYRKMLGEFRRLQNDELDKVGALQTEVDQLKAQLATVERKAQKRIVAVYKHVNQENERLTAEIHQMKMQEHLDVQIMKNRAILAEEQVIELKELASAEESQRSRLLHVHSVLLKYFQKHALWKSDGEDPNALATVGFSGPVPPGYMRAKRQTGQEMAEHQQQVKIGVHGEETNKDGKTGTDNADGDDEGLGMNIAAADAANEATAAHEHEKAEWKQIHLAMQALTDTHMHILNDHGALSELHAHQLEQAHARIAQLEREKVRLEVARGPRATQLPRLLAADDADGTSGDGNEGDRVNSGTTTRFARKMNGGKASVVVVGSGCGLGTRRLSNYQKRKIEAERTGFEGLEPIVVEILSRRPLPALDANAVIIKQQVKEASPPKRTQRSRFRSSPSRPVRRRPLHLHSHNQRSTFAQHQKEKHQKQRQRLRQLQEQAAVAADAAAEKQSSSDNKAAHCVQTLGGGAV